MQRLAEFVIGSLDLVQAHAHNAAEAGRRASHQAARVFAAALLALLAACLGLAAITVALVAPLGVPGALGVGALAALGLAVGVHRWRA